MEIEIKGVKYSLKCTTRAIIVFEKITGRMFNVSTLTDVYVFFYSVIVACNKNVALTFDEMIDAMDENPELCKQLEDFVKKEYYVEKAPEPTQEGK